MGLEEKKQVPFRGTAEQERQLLDFIEEHKQVGGCLMPIMQKAQEIYGYLPIEVQKVISDELHVPLAEIYGVVTFYARFSTQPKGKYAVSVCMGTACYVKGAGKILEKFENALGIKAGEVTDDGMFSLDACRCIGACGLAPVATVNGEVYGKLVQADVQTICDKYMNE